MLVHQIMQRPVIGIQPQTPLPAVARLLHTQRLTGVPVLDDRAGVVGIVTERDLLLKARRMAHTGDRLPSLFRQWTEPAQLLAAYRQAQHLTAADIMTQPVITCPPDDTAGHAAWLMAQHGIGHVPVVAAGELVGLVTRRDLIRLLAEEDAWAS